MNHAIVYSGELNRTAPKAEAKKAAPAVGAVCRLDETPQRRRRNTQGQTEICSGSDAANGFLKCLFLPKLKERRTIQDSKKAKKTERDFYKSLFQLAIHYNIQPMQTRQYGYPYSIALALDDIRHQLMNKIEHWEGIRLLQDSRKTFIESTERYNTGATLFYTPVIPLYKLLKNRKRKHAAQLLLSVCTYLYSKADVPYYRQENSFLYWQYEMLKEWILNDEHTDETTSYLCEIQQAEYIGDCMEKKICNSANLKAFKQRLTKFTPKDAFDNDCWNLAGEAFCLYNKYPDTSIFKNAMPNGEGDMDNVVTMDRYVSFCADGKGWLNENLEQTVDSELSQYGQVEEPMIVKHFNGKTITNNSFDFETRIFSLVEELAYLLKNH
ncbi:MAG: hypothetical protein H3C48_11280 [Chitinophagaceae bacterium]|nr:hypothetical protein [Chitinophagaceae bacterium]